MVITKSLTTVVNKEIEWLWQPFIPLGKVTMIQGDTGIGKTSVLVKVMADLSNGLYPPTMQADHLLPRVKGEPIKIFYVSIENGMADTIAPVFDHFHGNREGVWFQDESMGHFVLNGNEIREVVKQTGAKMIIIDPWQQFLDDIESSNNKGVRDLIGELQLAAEELNISVVFTGNYTKSGGSSEAQKGIGGAELSNTLRCILTINRSDLGPYIRLVKATKMSVPGKEMTPVAMQMYDDDLHYVDYLEIRDALSDADKKLRDQNAPFPEIGFEDDYIFDASKHSSIISFSGAGEKDGTGAKTFAEEKLAKETAMKRNALDGTALKGNTFNGTALGGSSLDGIVSKELTAAPKSATERAVEFLKRTLAYGPVESNEVKRLAAEEGISEASLKRAKKKAHVVFMKSGDGVADWKLDYTI